MKKLSFLSRVFFWLTPKDTRNSDNKNIILTHLFKDNFIDLSTEESISLFNEIRDEFEAQLVLRRLNAKEEIGHITKYFKDE